MDMREKFITEIEESLALLMDCDDLDVVMNSIISKLDGYELSERVTDLVASEDGNENILKRYAACILIDGKSKKTVQSYIYRLRNLSKILMKNYKDMDTYDIRYYLAYLKQQGNSNCTLDSVRGCLSAFFQWMTAEEIIEKNPMLRIKRIQFTKQVKIPFSNVEIDTLRNACQTVKERALIEVLLTSGVRVSELCMLDRDDVDFKNLSLHVRYGKGDKQRITYISDVAVTYLRLYLNTRNDSCPELFRSKRGRLTAQGVRFILHDIGNRANIENVHPHRFRRTFATGLSVRGMELQEVSALLGHSKLTTTMTYVCLNDTQIKHDYIKYIA